MNSKKTVQWILGGLALLVLPLVLQYFGNAWVRIADLALLYVLLALGLNVVVGYAGLLDLAAAAEIQSSLLPQDTSVFEQLDIAFEPDVTLIAGVSRGKAIRYGKPFIQLIAKYVEENEVERPDDILIRQVANKSKVKVQIIQGIDRKMPLDDLAKSNQLSLDELLTEMEAIVESGTKLNIDYYIEEAIDEGARDEIYDYFMEAETDLLKPAIKSLQEEDITEEEIRIFRIKFLSDLAN